MNYKLIRLLVFACISLCLVISVEWLYADYAQHRLLTSISLEKQQDYKIDALPEIELTKQPKESYVDLVARPLFIKDRRAVDEPSPEFEQAAEKSDGFDWLLTGIYSINKTVSALFSRSKSKVTKDNYRKITVGNDLDGWKLTEINKDRVILKQSTNEKILLLRKLKLKVFPQGGGAQEANGEIPSIPSPFSMPNPKDAPAADPTENTNEDFSEKLKKFN